MPSGRVVVDFIVRHRLVVALIVMLVVAMIALLATKGRRMERMTTPFTATTSLSVTKRPWGVCFTRDGAHMFVGTSVALEVYKVNWTTTPPTFDMVKRLKVRDAKFHGLALSNSGNVLVSGNDTFISTYDVNGLIAAPSTTTRPALLARATIPPGVKKGASEVLFSQDDAYVFVTMEYGKMMVVYDARTLAQVRTVPTNKLPVGLTLLQHPTEGALLLFTSQYKEGRPYCSPTGQSTDCSGTLTIVSLTSWASREVDVGCCPVRVAATGGKIFITARGENKVRVLDLNFKPVGEIPTGPAPVSVKATNDGRVLVVTASDRFSTPPRNGKVHFFDPVSLRELATADGGKFPRTVGVAPNGWVAVANFNSDSVQMFNPTPLLT